MGTEKPWTNRGHTPPDQPRTSLGPAALSESPKPSGAVGGLLISASVVCSVGDPAGEVVVQRDRLGSSEVMFGTGKVRVG